MNAQRDDSTNLVTVVALIAAVCCVVPALATAGVFGIVAGIGLRSWLLVGVGIVLAGGGALQWPRHRQRTHS
jgi:hypothetical protein